MKPNVDHPERQPTQMRSGQVIDLDKARRKGQPNQRGVIAPEILQEAHRIRTWQNVIALLLVGFLIAGGAWLIVRLRDGLQTEICIEAGRRNCIPSDFP